MTLTANSGSETYDGTEKTVTGFTSSVEGVEFEGVSASGSGTDAGEYEVTITGAIENETLDTTGNYVVAQTVNGTLTVNKAESVAATVTANNAICTGTAQPLVNVTGEAVGGTIQYSLDGETFSEAIPTGTDVGTYTVTYRVVGDVNHNDTEPETLTVTIEERPEFTTPDFTLPAQLEAIEESAFEGLTAMTVVDAHNCASIGRDAFKDTGLNQIRLPKDCAIDPAAFGTQKIYVFAPAGGTTEAYCAEHDNLIFIEE